MKTALCLLALVSSFGVTSAHATEIVPYVHCQLAQRIMDFGYDLSIVKEMGPPVAGRPMHSDLSATLMTEGMMGPREIGTWTVTQTQSNGVGASIIFVGDGFSLDLVIDAPRQSGTIPAHLIAETRDGSRVSEEMACTITQAL